MGSWGDGQRDRHSDREINRYRLAGRQKDKQTDRAKVQNSNKQVEEMSYSIK